MGHEPNKLGKVYFLSLALAVLTAGCSSTASSTRQTDLTNLNRQQSATIASLQKEVQRLNTELAGVRMSRANDLQQTQADLEASLQGEVQSGNLFVSMEDRGVVVTVLDRVLFAPGRAELKTGSIETLDKVAEVLQGEAQGHVIYIEGHTDNVPIRASTWKSNWELSTARATEVIHYFTEYKGIDPVRLAATGYGEYQPVVSNETPEGRMKNRRVEIVISPKKITA
jgi:chemotaxis protein MotB